MLPDLALGRPSNNVEVVVFRRPARLQPEQRGWKDFQRFKSPARERRGWETIS